MKTYPTFYLIALLVITCSTNVFSQMGSGSITSAPANLELLEHKLVKGNDVNVSGDNVILTSYNDNDNLFLDPIQVSNAAGISVNDKVVIKIVSASQLELDLSTLPSGIYQIKTKTGTLTVEKK